MITLPMDATMPPSVQVGGGFVLPRGASARADPKGRSPEPAVARAAPSQADVEAAVAHANNALRQVNASVQFEIDPDTDITVVKVVDTTNSEVLRQIPTQEMLDIAKSIDRMQGVLVQQKA